MLWQQVTIKIDTLNERLMLPAYAGGLLVGLLLLEATCQFRPEQLRRLRLITCLVVVPLLLVPGARVLKQHDTVAKPIENWVRPNTTDDSLLIGRRIWEIRYATGRTVVTSEYGKDKSAALDGVAVSTFLWRHGDRFDGIYLVVSHDDWPKARESFGSAGIRLRPAYADDTHTRDGVSVLQIQSWATSAKP